MGKRKAEASDSEEDLSSDSELSDNEVPAKATNAAEEKSIENAKKRRRVKEGVILAKVAGQYYMAPFMSRLITVLEKKLEGKEVSTETINEWIKEASIVVPEKKEGKKRGESKMNGYRMFCNAMRTRATDECHKNKKEGEDKKFIQRKVFTQLSEWWKECNDQKKWVDMAAEFNAKKLKDSAA